MDFFFFPALKIHLSVNCYERRHILYQYNPHSYSNFWSKSKFFKELYDAFLLSPITQNLLQYFFLYICTVLCISTVSNWWLMMQSGSSIPKDRLTQRRLCSNRWPFNWKTTTLSQHYEKVCSYFIYAVIRGYIFSIALHLHSYVTEVT